MRKKCVTGCLPGGVLDALRDALPLLDRKVKGFAAPDSVLTGVETRSSSPVRILRDKTSLLASFASTLLALFLDRNVSAPPAMAPDRPALLPDWSMTTAISARQSST